MEFSICVYAYMYKRAYTVADEFREIDRFTERVEFGRTAGGSVR